MKERLNRQDAKDAKNNEERDDLPAESAEGAEDENFEMVVSELNVIPRVIVNADKRLANRERVNALLGACGQPPVGVGGRVRRLGAGAWHDAFLVRDGGRALVARLRKRVIYGSAEVFDEGVIRSDYAGVGEYYRVANLRRPGICPERYAYVVGPEVSGTVESYLGPTLRLGALSTAAAYALGREIGRAFQVIQAGEAPCPGWGELAWTAEGVRGEDARPFATIAEEEVGRWRAGVARLGAAGFEFDATAARQRLEGVLARRAGYALVPALVNSDITPENLSVRRGRFGGLVDPVPHIGSAVRYAALFSVVYRLLLPSLHDAPRYAGRGFGEHADEMAHIADGYEAGYLEDGPETLALALADETWLWVLDLAIGGYDRLGTPLSAEQQIRFGSHAAIERRVRGYLRVLSAEC